MRRENGNAQKKTQLKEMANRVAKSKKNNVS